MNLLFQDASLLFQDMNLLLQVMILLFQNKTEIKSIWPYFSSVTSRQKGIMFTQYENSKYLNQHVYVNKRDILGTHWINFCGRFNKRSEQPAREAL